MDKSIGLKIKEARRTSKLSQTQLSQFLGIDQTNLSKIESCERPIGIVNLKKIANLFGMSLLDFQFEAPINEKLELSFRADNINPEDLEKISILNRIAANSALMEKILEDNGSAR